MEESIKAEIPLVVPAQKMTIFPVSAVVREMVRSKSFSEEFFMLARLNGGDEAEVLFRRAMHGVTGLMKQFGPKAPAIASKMWFVMSPKNWGLLKTAIPQTVRKKYGFRDEWIKSEGPSVAGQVPQGAFCARELFGMGVSIQEGCPDRLVRWTQEEKTRPIDPGPIHTSPDPAQPAEVKMTENYFVDIPHDEGPLLFLMARDFKPEWTKMQGPPPAAEKKP